MAGRKIDRIAAHIDILPTLLDACGIEPQKIGTIDGASLWPLLSDEAEHWPDRTLFFQFHRGMRPQIYQNCAVRTQRYKLVSKHGSTAERQSGSPPLKPVFELYDVETDPGENHNIARSNPELVARMKADYENWFATMHKTRDFAPGVIVIGSKQENPSYLCRYQDSHYTDGAPRGWPVQIVQAGQYEVSINRSGYMGKGKLSLKIDTYFESHDLEQGANKAVFSMPETTGVLDIWFEEKGMERRIFTKNHTIGDVELRKL